MHALAGALERGGDGMLGEPVHLQLRLQPAQLARDRDVAPRVAEPDRRGEVERALAPRAAAHPGPRRARRREEVAQQPVHAHRVAGVREVPGALHHHQLAAGRLGHRAAARERPDAVVVAVQDEHRAGDALAERGEPRPVVHQLPAEMRQGERVGRRVEAPADAVLDLLRRVRLAERLAEEELEELAVVLEPERAVPLRPALVGVEARVEVRHDARAVLRERRRRADQGDALDALGVLGGEQRRPQRAGGQRHQERSVRARGVQHRDRVGGELALGVRLDGFRAVGAPVAAAVERHHAGVPREVRDLRLPVARVDDRPRRQQQHRRLAGAVDLVGDADAVALDLALFVRVDGAGLLPAAGGHVRGGHGRSFASSQRSIHSSSAPCPVSTPDSRSRMMPSLNVATSETRASSGRSIP